MIYLFFFLATYTDKALRYGNGGQDLLVSEY